MAGGVRARHFASPKIAAKTRGLFALWARRRSGENRRRQQPTPQFRRQVAKSPEGSMQPLSQAPLLAQAPESENIQEHWHQLRALNAAIHRIIEGETLPDPEKKPMSASILHRHPITNWTQAAVGHSSEYHPSPALAKMNLSQYNDHNVSLPYDLNVRRPSLQTAQCRPARVFPNMGCRPYLKRVVIAKIHERPVDRKTGSAMLLNDRHGYARPTMQGMRQPQQDSMQGLDAAESYNPRLFRSNKYKIAGKVASNSTGR